MAWSKMGWLASLRGCGLTPAQFTVLVTMSTYTDRDGQHARPSLATLAKDTGMNTKTVKAAIRNLVADGHLVLTAAGGNQFGKGRANEYRLGEPAPEQPVEPAARGASVTPLEPRQGGAEVVPFKSRRGPSDAHEGAQITPTKGPNSYPPIQKEQSRKDGSGKNVAVRSEVRDLCEHLRDRIVANGSRKPTITTAWLDNARLLIDLDKRPVDEAHRLIDWCQKDSFWRSNVLSMPTFRAKYDQLRLQAARPDARSSARPGNLTNQQWQQALERAQQRQEGM